MQNEETRREGGREGGEGRGGGSCVPKRNGVYDAHGGISGREIASTTGS